ncbi:MAG: hypothetical protein RL670_980 [Actinomycetota bacterium]|jgi:uncharacterized protein (DUF305 family)
MKSHFARTATIATATALSALILAGCTFNLGPQNPPPQGQSKQDQADQSPGRMNAAVMFAQMMIPHHQQAVDLGTLAETRASSPAVKALAAKIKAEQAPEISLMKGWLKDAGIDPDRGMGHMGHGMDGMLTGSQMSELETAKGKVFDSLFLTRMIAHHEGAVQMAKEVETSGDAKLAKLAKAIIKSQTEQIAYMKELKKK